MAHDQDLQACVDEAALLLPWYVNGTLAPTDAQRFEAHLADCAACRAELREQQQLRSLMRTPAQVEYAPQAGWRRLLARIDADGAVDDEAPTVAAIPPAAARERSRTTPWLAAAVVVQAVALAALAGAGLLGGPASDSAPRYRTLTSAPAPPGVELRVVFTPATTLAELGELLRANRLDAVAGPSEAGLFTLALPRSANGDDAPRAVLARLRADPHVLFAELRGADAR